MNNNDALREALESYTQIDRCEDPIRTQLPNPEGYASKTLCSPCGECRHCKAVKALAASKPEPQAQVNTEQSEREKLIAFLRNKSTVGGHQYDCRMFEKAAALLAADKAGGEMICDEWRRKLIAYGDARAKGNSDQIAAAFVDALYTHPKPQPSALPDGVVKDAVLAELDELGDDAAVHIYPDFSVRVGNPAGERSVPLFSREQVVAALDAAMLKEGKSA